MKSYNVTEGSITYSVDEYSNGTKYWYLNHQLHRVNGPAVEYTNGDKCWYYHGTEIICNFLKDFNKQIKLLSIS